MQIEACKSKESKHSGSRDFDQETKKACTPFGMQAYEMPSMMSGSGQANSFARHNASLQQTMGITITTKGCRVKTKL
jgi:hypothetical protein